MLLICGESYLQLLNCLAGVGRCLYLSTRKQGTYGQEQPKDLLCTPSQLSPRRDTEGFRQHQRGMQGHREGLGCGQDFQMDRADAENSQGL